MNEFEQKLIANIAEYGWQANFVFDPDGGPDFTYSVGFPTSLGCPDCIVVGLGKDVMRGMLWEIHDQIKAGKTLFDGAKWDGLLDGDFTCRSLSVPSQDDLGDFRMMSAEWYWNRVLQRQAPFRAFQIVWPSAQFNRYPWDADCPQDVLDYQPLFGHPPA